jgi:hypothetical protein
MIGFPFNPSPAMALTTCAGRFGASLQVIADDPRLMTSQLVISYPPQTSTLGKSRKKLA